MMKQNRASSLSCASPISGEPTIHFRIGIRVHWIEKEIKFRRTDYPNVICNFSSSIPWSAIQSSSSQVPTISNKHRVITNKDNHEQKANLNRSFHVITTITFAVEGIGNWPSQVPIVVGSSSSGPDTVLQPTRWCRHKMNLSDHPWNTNLAPRRDIFSLGNPTPNYIL
jgi:hypothetical protein